LTGKRENFKVNIKPPTLCVFPSFPCVVLQEGARGRGLATKAYRPCRPTLRTRSNLNPDEVGVEGMEIGAVVLVGVVAALVAELGGS